ncbi:MAG: hypothetical protein ABJI96_09555 [Paracoccaceae bacterium]
MDRTQGAFAPLTRDLRQAGINWATPKRRWILAAGEGQAAIANEGASRHGI